jgi:predicted nucleic acid-binding protein
MHDSEIRCFVDSNVWLYAFIEGGDANKSFQARSLVQANDITVSTQVINEVCVNLVKKASFAEADVRRLVASFYRRYTVGSLGQATLTKASKIRGRHSFSFWDSLIVASAILAGVDVLYSEDMQDGFEIENVRIVNPFSVDQSHKE